MAEADQTQRACTYTATLVITMRTVVVHVVSRTSNSIYNDDGTSTKKLAVMVGTGLYIHGHLCHNNENGSNKCSRRM